MARTKLTARGVVAPPQNITIEELLEIASQYEIYIPKGSTKSEIIVILAFENNIFKKIEEANKLKNKIN